MNQCVPLDCLCPGEGYTASCADGVNVQMLNLTRQLLLWKYER